MRVEAPARPDYFDVFLRSENGGRAFANDGMIVRNQNAIMFVGNDFIWASNDS